MATWRRRALDQFPELRRELSGERRYTVHAFYFDLLPRVKEAHESGNDELLRRAYGFATWCLAQRGESLRNATVAAFLEHLFDNWALRGAVAPWPTCEMIDATWPEWRRRLGIRRAFMLGRLLRGTSAQQPPTAV